VGNVNVPSLPSLLLSTDWDEACSDLKSILRMVSLYLYPFRNQQQVLEVRYCPFCEGVYGKANLSLFVNWTVSTATSSQYLAVNCEPTV
jgi:hypothetical protein